MGGSVPKRILGLELLRGLCALLVALYHCLLLGQVAEFPTWGWYGVYVFFGISGAVLHYNYHGTLGTELGIPAFLLKRFARLAPLYALCALIPVILHWQWVPDRDFLNVSLLFGFVSPGATQSVTGGWSLGIEFALYALFPTLLAFAKDTKTALLALLAFLLLRMAFIHYLMRDGSLTDSWGLYTQAGSFLFFFFGGMLVSRHMSQATLRPWLIAAVGVACGALLFAIPGSSADEVVAGAWGWSGSALALLIVAGFYWSPSSALGAAVCRFFGEISYGLYLLHPILWFSSIKHLPDLTAWQRTVIVIPAAVGLAWALRFYERPMRRLILRAFG